MTELHNYIPNRTKRLSNFKDIWLKLKKEINIFFETVIHTVSFYDGNIEPANKQLEFQEDITEEQVDQCREIFENSNKRREKLESKAEKLLTLLAIFIPIFSVFLAYIFSSKLPFGHLKLLLYLTLGISILSVLIAFIAIYRTRKIGEVEGPFLSSIVDCENDKIHVYSKKREGLGYLYCAINNEVRNDHLADFVRAAEYFILISLAFLVISVPMIIVIKSANVIEPTISISDIIQTEGREIKQSIDNINSSIKLVNSQMESIGLLLNSNNYNIRDQYTKQSELINDIIAVSKKQIESTDEQITIIKELIDKYKEKAEPKETTQQNAASDN